MMKTKLNYSKKLFFGIKFTLILLIINGCAEIYSYQPAAPVYGAGQTTNPYERQTKTEVPVDTKQQSSVQTTPLSESTSRSDLKINTIPAKQPLSPAVVALISEANQSSKAGDLETAVSTIERALRIDPRNPTLTYKLAKLRLQQSKPRLAEDLAKKAALLANNDKALKKQSWLLISEARRQQKNYYGAKEAKLKADNI